MARPRLAAPHICSTPGCGKLFTRNGQVKPVKRCPRCYSRQRRGSLIEKPAEAPAVRMHVSLPADVVQRAAAYLDEALGGSPSMFSGLVGDALVAFLDRAEAECARRTAQGKDE